MLPGARTELTTVKQSGRVGRLEEREKDTTADLRVRRCPLVHSWGSKPLSTDCEVVVCDGAPGIQVIALNEVLQVSKEGLVECNVARMTGSDGYID
jgi:hypothetical protein